MEHGPGFVEAAVPDVSTALAAGAGVVQRNWAEMHEVLSLKLLFSPSFRCAGLVAFSLAAELGDLQSDKLGERWLQSLLAQGDILLMQSQLVAYSNVEFAVSQLEQDAVEYWKAQIQWPELAKFATCMLHLPLSSAEVDRVFSIP